MRSRAICKYLCGLEVGRAAVAVCTEFVQLERKSCHFATCIGQTLAENQKEKRNKSVNDAWVDTGSFILCAR